MTSKLHRALPWYSIDGAAKRLSATLGEDVRRADVFTLAAEGELQVQFFLKRPYMAIPVVPWTELPTNWHSRRVMVERRAAPPIGSRLRRDVDTDLVFYVQGFVTLSLAQGGGWAASPAKSLFMDLAADEQVALEDLSCEVTYIYKGDDEYALWTYADPNNCDVGIMRTKISVPVSEMRILREDLQEFEDRVADPDPRLAEQDTQLEAKSLEATPLGELERGTLYKLLYVMARHGYEYDPESKRSSVPSEIARQAKGLDLSLDADTVRKHLAGTMARNHRSKASPFPVA